PPPRCPCHCGNSVPDTAAPIANPTSMDKRWQYSNADSVGYLDMKGMVKATVPPANSFCFACFNGNYPLAVDPALDKFIMEKREQRAKALADQEAHPTLFADLK